MNKKIKSISLVYIILIISILFTGCKFVTVVPLNNDKGNTKFYYEDADFDPAKYVQEKWPDIVKFAKENTKPLTEVVALYSSDPAACGEKFGHRATEKDIWNFLVTGTAKVLKVNQESQNGLIELDIEPYDGKADCYLQIGPVVKGNALRDSMTFISFKDFKNQLTFGDVGKAINKYSVENISSKLTLDSLQDKQMTFVGAFSQGSTILIVPTEILVS